MLHMLNALPLSLLADTAPGQAIVSHGPIAPALILILCVVAGLGTWLFLPSRTEITVRRIGGVVLALSGLVFAALLIRWVANLPHLESESAPNMGVYFWVFSAIAIFASVRVVTHTKPVYSALYFVLTVFSTAGLFVLMWAEFMAAALVLIYAGAILITYVFVIMLASEAATGGVGTKADSRVGEQDTVSRDPFLACATGFLVMGLLLMVIIDRMALPETAPIRLDTSSQLASTDPKAAGAEIARVEKVEADFSGSAQGLGRELIKNHALNLELAGVLLTIAMVGAITLARRRVIVSESDRGIVENVVSPFTPADDNPHSIEVTGTTNPRQKAYPED